MAAFVERQLHDRPFIAAEETRHALQRRWIHIPGIARDMAHVLDGAGVRRVEAMVHAGGEPQRYVGAVAVSGDKLLFTDEFSQRNKLNGEVSRKMWQPMWPEKTVAEVPITSVTNGVHVPTWLAPELSKLYSKYLGQDWLRHHDEPKFWERIHEIPDEDLWSLHQRLRAKLTSFMRERARHKWMSEGTGATHALASGTLFDPEALTIGFARRFATYKRALLAFRDMERLKNILQDSWRPVQIVFAGKAHPDDAPGRGLIHSIYEIAREAGMGGHIAFVEDYDILIAKHLYHGVDVWMNNPRPPLEASGTSGMKAALNGAPNFSVRDGWWYEGYHGTNGWVIGTDPMAEIGDEERDAADAESLYSTLEKELVPLFYNRDSDGVPRGWVQVMKEAIKYGAPAFSARRMVKEYAERMYLPAMKAAEKK